VGEETGTFVYPLGVSANGRYLVDQFNVPFILIGDDAASLMVDVSPADAEHYLAKRASQGFNVISTELICNSYGGGRSDASTFDGLIPFTTPGDLSTPHEAYFARCDGMIRAAARHGLTVMLNPAEVSGFLGLLRANGLEKCRAFGRFLGSRYRGFDNLIWKSGCDFQTWQTDSDNALVAAVVEGIRENDQRHIHTIQLNYQVSSSRDSSRWGPLIELEAVYSYYPAYAEVLVAYDRTPAIPVFLVESDYEFENEADDERLRRQAYWSFLAGSCGHVYGNRYVWPMLSGWADRLDTVGAAQLGRCKTFFESLAWPSLAPDQGHDLVTSGLGTFWTEGEIHSGISANDYVTAAAAGDGTLAVVYVPSERTITVDLARMSGDVTARWFDPTTGTYHAVAGSPFPHAGPQLFTTPGAHADGASDWILLLEAR